MRQERNNEIDLLLRRLSRRHGVPASDDDSHNGSDHLDADELNSYAENTLPTAARARYTEHLAECSRCRELVVQLSASVPVVAARDTVTAVAPSGLRKFLASFFSPMVLRYAVPALGLIVVAAIGFVVFRSNSPRDSVAQLNEHMQGATSAPAPAPSEQPAAAFDDSSPRTASPAEARKLELSKDTAPVTTPQSKPDSGDVAGQRRDEPAPPSTQPQTVANAAPAAPTTASPATVDEMQVNVEARRANEETRSVPAKDLGKQKVAQDTKEQEKKLEVASAARPESAKGRVAAPQSGAGTNSLYSVAEADADKNKDDGVIRTAGGRRFRKQSGVWVDTAYNSGSQIVNVSRGSEQYRALIADEPTIKTIADALDGIVVVVWKGRTYRIR